MANLEQQKSKLEETKRKLKEKENMRRGKERIQTQNALSNLGQLFVRTKLSHLDQEILLGALLEISEKSKDEKVLENWRKKSQQHSATTIKGNPITISFKNPPAFEIKEQLKSMNFKWHSFRGEYYGHGDKSIMEKLLANHDCKIEIIG